MTTTAASAVRRPDPARRAVAAAVVALVGVGVLGAVMGVRTLAGSGTAVEPAGVPATSAGDAHAGVHRIEDQIRTGFGWMAVVLVDKSSGVPARALGGNTHFPSFTGADKVQVQVTLDIRNTLPQRHVVRADQFTLLAGRKRYAPRRSTSPMMQIQPDAAAGQILSYTLPRNNQRLTLQFTEVPGATPIRVDLGRAQARVEGAGPGGRATPADEGHGHAPQPTTPGKP